MATFCYRVRSTQKNKLAKVQIHFTVGRGNQFYADTQYLVLTDAWDSKRQTVKSRYAAVEDFTEQQGRELMKNLSELRSFILGEIAKDPEYAMTKTKLEKSMRSITLAVLSVASVCAAESHSRIILHDMYERWRVVSVLIFTNCATDFQLSRTTKVLLFSLMNFAG